MSDTPWTRGLPNGRSKGIVRLYLQCQSDPTKAALVNAAEVWYRVEEKDPESGDPDQTIIHCRYPCPCIAREHEAIVARIDG